MDDDVDVRGDEALHVLVERIGTGQHGAPRQDGCELPDAALFGHAHAVADGQGALLAHGQLRRDDAVELLAVVEDAATAAGDAEDDAGALQIVRRRRDSLPRRAAPAAGACRRWKRVCGVAMLVEQASQLSSVTRCSRTIAFVLAERLADLARPFFGFHLVVREVLFEVLLELLRFTIHAGATSRGLVRV